MRMPKVLFPPVVLLLLAAGCKEKPAAAPATPKVAVVTVVPRDVPIYQEWIGTLDGYPNAQIRAQVTGLPHEAEITRRGATSDEGTCCSRSIRARFRRRWTRPWPKSSKTRRCWARPNWMSARYTPLAKTKAVSQEQLGRRRAGQSDGQGGRGGGQGGGGNRQAEPWLSPGLLRPWMGLPAWPRRRSATWSGPTAAVLTTVSTLESHPRLFQHQRTILFGLLPPIRAAPGSAPRQEDVPLQLILSDGSVYPAPGKWIFTGRQVDVDHGHIAGGGGVRQSRTTFSGPGNTGWSGPKPRRARGALLVPQRAVTELQGAWQVAVDRRSQHRAHQDRPGGRANRHRLADRKRSGSPTTASLPKAPRKSRRAQRLTRNLSRPRAAGKQPARPSPPGEKQG